MPFVLFRMPARYMSENATEEHNGVYNQYKEWVGEIARGERSSLILPSECDPETRRRLFTIQVVDNETSGYEIIGE